MLTVRRCGENKAKEKRRIKETKSKMKEEEMKRNIPSRGRMHKKVGKGRGVWRKA